MNILLLGKNGQVGQELTRTLTTLGQLTALSHSELELSNPLAISDTLKSLKPQVIVNAAAYTAVDQAESQPNEAYAINHHAVEQLAHYAKIHDAILVHYSTDYVFDGTKQGAYLEADQTNPLNVYGASKLAGEQAILDSGCRGYIFRTSWVYSLYGKNFINTILNLAKQKESMRIVNDQQGAPTSAALISDITLVAVREALREQFSPGLYHLTAKGITTWYDLASYVIKQLNLLGVELKLQASQITPIASEEYPVPALRPKNSALNNNKIESALKVILPDWTVHLNHMIQQLIRT